MKNDRSIFFPMALIAAGTLWILVSMGRIPAQNLWALAHFWPFLLIGAGLALILRSYWAPGRALVDLLVVGGAVLAVVFAPQLGWTSPEWAFGLENSFSGGVRGSGKVITEAREVRDISKVSISVPAEVLIQQGDAELVKIEAEDNLMPQISSQVVKGVLEIRNKTQNWQERVNATQPVRITIMVKNLSSLELSSTGQVTIKNLETNDLVLNVSGTGNLKVEKISATKIECNLSGAGSVTIAGSASDLVINISGVGSFDGASLLDKTVSAHISGTGNATVNPSDSLTATISGVGSIHYYGSPTVNQTISGLGSVSKINE